MNNSPRKLVVDWGHLTILVLIAGYTLWYNVDARSVSLDVNNLLLVQPLAVIILALCLFVLPQCFSRQDAGDTPSAASQAAETDTNTAPDAQTKGRSEARDMVKMLSMGGLLGLYVFALTQIGFDVSTFLFMAASMALCGERRPLALIAYPAITTFVLIYGFKALMPYPMPTLLF